MPTLINLLQISVLDHFLASGDEIGKGFSLQHTVAKKREIHNLVKDFVAGSEGFNIGTMGFAYCFTGLAGFGLFLIRSICRGFCGQFGLGGDIGKLGFPNLGDQRILHVDCDVVALGH